MGWLVSLKNQLQLFLADKEMPLPEIYSAFPREKKHVIRGRINESIGNFFNRVRPGVYTAIVGQYQLVLADPPWQYDDNKTRGSAENHYVCMTTEQIKSLPVAELCQEDAVLFLWSTWTHLKDAIAVMESWGFTYKTCAFVLVKLNKDGTPFMGMGHYTRANTEPCLLGIRRKGVPVLKHDINQVVMQIKEVHSKKPAVIYKHIENLHGSVKRLELFARDVRADWHQWGNELPSTTQTKLQ